MSEIQLPKPSDVQWYIQVAEGKKAGPTTFERLQQFVKVGKILPETKIRKKTDSAWVFAHTIPGLFDSSNTETENQSVELTEESIPVTDEPIAETPEESKKIEKTGSSVFTVNVGENKPKPAVTKNVAFKINPKRTEPKEEKTAEKTIEKTEEKPSEKSSVSVKIAFDTPNDKSKVEKKSSVKSSSMFKISTKPVQKEGSPSPSTESSPTEFVESTAIPAVISEEKQEKKEKKFVLLLNKKTLFLMATAIFSVLVGLIGGLTLAMLNPKTTAFSVTIGVIVFLFGIILGIVSWSLTLLFNQMNR